MSKRLRAFLVTDSRVEPVNDFLAWLSDGGVSDADVTVQVLPAPPGSAATFVAVVTYADRVAPAPQPIALAAPAAGPRADPVRVQGSRWR
ncbi:MAG TPA: hypothetical protein VFN57_04660 [Thermomicrobiaceae bacterium]|nr:hypothetical protein [Thermomicrobiaceae bacterium]